tara:strand:- start:1586 stop:1768 length:183 start_codon:yes stop_codon:yes gene_type:complete
MDKENHAEIIDELKTQLKVQIQCGKDMRYIIKGLEEDLAEKKEDYKILKAKYRMVKKFAM